MFGIETSILLVFQSLRLPFLTQLAALVSSLDNYGFVWIVLGIVMIVFPEKRGMGVTVIGSVIVTGIIVGFILQPAFHHVRPNEAGIGITAVMGVSRMGFSFPSFHAATSFAAAMVIAMMSGRRWGTWAFVGAFLIAMSRMYLGVEFPSDVIVGAVVGVLVGLLSTWVYNQFLHDVMRDLTVGGRSKSARSSISPSRQQRRRK